MRRLALTQLPDTLPRPLRHATWLVPLSWMGLLWHLLTMEADIDHSAPWVIPHLDKLVHFGICAVLAWCLLLPGRFSLRMGWWWAALLAFISASAYGGYLEYLQTTLAHRHGNWADVVANALGAATVWLWPTILARRHYFQR